MSTLKEYRMNSQYGKCLLLLVVCLFATCCLPGVVQKLFANPSIGANVVTVRFVSSGGLPIDGAQIHAYMGLSGWQAQGDTDGNGELAFNLPEGTEYAQIRISYAGGVQELKQDIGEDSTVRFQTVKTIVELKDNTGNGIGEGIVKYKRNFWNSFGQSDANGQVTKELLRGTYTFRMEYAGGVQEIKQDIGEDSTVSFQTVKTIVELKDNTGNGIGEGIVKYKRSFWNSFGQSDAKGQVSKELLRGTYTFRMEYAGGVQEIKQDIGEDSTVRFQTVKTIVELKDNAGNGIGEGVVKYKRSFWNSFGQSGANGQVSKELLRGTYTFRMEYAGGVQEIKQDIGEDSTVRFQTVKTIVELKDNAGNGIGEGVVKYKRSLWNSFGLSGANGQVSKELLRGTYTFRMEYAGGVQEIKQDIGEDSTVRFQTVKTIVELKDNAGNGIGEGVVKYKRSLWNSFGLSGANGQVSKELLRGTYTFTASYDSKKQTIQQDVTVNPYISFKFDLVVEPLPLADFAATVREANVPGTIQFTDNSKNAVEWLWDLDGDGTIDSREQNPRYTYDQVGTYDVALTVRNGMGTDTVKKTGYIQILEDDQDDVSPSMPEGLTPISTGANYVSFYWNAATDNVGVVGYHIYRDGILVSSTKALEYMDQNLTANTEYSYQVSAYDESGNESVLSDILLLQTTDTNTNASIPAFPGAQGFGAETTGGRGGDVVYVTNLNPAGPGSLNDALGFHGNAQMAKPRYILFKTSGLVNSTGNAWLWDHIPHIEYGDFTLAAHTSPGGIIVPGIHTWKKYEDLYTNEGWHLNNMIIRHLRSRPHGGNAALDDAIRLNKAQGVILDHCSFGHAWDECMQISYNKNFTVQNCLFAETLGEHWDRGGILIKYGSEEKPNTDISFHHNMLNRIGGRMPQCGWDNQDGQSMRIEISNNVLWDPASTNGILASMLLTNFHYEGQFYQNNWFLANMVNNYSFALPVVDNGRIIRIGSNHENDLFYINGNQLSIPSNRDIVSCSQPQLSQRHPFPEITYTPTENLVDYMVDNVGAFPRDAMDRRLMGFVEQQYIDPTPCGEKGADDGHVFDWSLAPLPYLDSDDDGMPDEWELHNGLNPLVQDHNGKELSAVYTGINGYDNLECFLNRYSDHLVKGMSLTEGSAHVYPIVGLEATVSSEHVTPGQEVVFRIVVDVAEQISKVELSLDLLEAPYAWPSPNAVDITPNSVGQNTWEFTYTIPEDRQAGVYDVLIHVQNEDEEDGYTILPISIY